MPTINLLSLLESAIRTWPTDLLFFVTVEGRLISRSSRRRVGWTFLLWYTCVTHIINSGRPYMGLSSLMKL